MSGSFAEADQGGGAVRSRARKRATGASCRCTNAAASLAGQQALYGARARILKALAHPTRLFIVERLARKSHCVCELADMVGADQSTVSQHLAILRSAGIVADEKRGRQVWYRVHTPCVLDFLSCVEEVLEANLREQQAALEGGRR
jgi:DNA-binding transcriptional ArsR family regulator